MTIYRLTLTESWMAGTFAGSRVILINNHVIKVYKMKATF